MHRITCLLDRQIAKRGRTNLAWWHPCPVRKPIHGHAGRKTTTLPPALLGTHSVLSRSSRPVRARKPAHLRFPWKVGACPQYTPMRQKVTKNTSDLPVFSHSCSRSFPHRTNGLHRISGPNHTTILRPPSLARWQSYRNRCAGPSDRLARAPSMAEAVPPLGILEEGERESETGSRNQPVCIRFLLSKAMRGFPRYSGDRTE